MTTWAEAVSGNFGDASKWTDSVLPSATETAAFNAEGTYAVFLKDGAGVPHNYTALSMSQGTVVPATVTLQLEGKALSILENLTTTTLLIRNSSEDQGVVLVGVDLIARELDASGNVRVAVADEFSTRISLAGSVFNNGAELESANEIDVGHVAAGAKLSFMNGSTAFAPFLNVGPRSPITGTATDKLSIKTTSIVTAALSTVGGEDDSKGEIEIVDVGSALKTDHLTIGVEGNGVVSVGQGAQLIKIETALVLVLGKENGSHGTLFVDGKVGETASRVEADTIDVGLAGTGYVTITGKGKAIARILRIGGDADDGNVDVKQVDSELTVAEQILLGVNGGRGNMTIEDEAIVNTEYVEIGSAVAGSNESVVAVRDSGVLSVGENGGQNGVVVAKLSKGSIQVEDEGQAFSPKYSIGAGSQGTGSVKLRGTLMTVQGNEIYKGPLVVGESSQGSLDVSLEGRVLVESLDVGKATGSLGIATGGGVVAFGAGQSSVKPR
jgi:hypothetical protein